jgi:uncharacterized protein YycO
MNTGEQCARTISSDHPGLCNQVTRPPAVTFPDLMAGDIFGSTNQRLLSKCARRATGNGPLSHARVYSHENYVVEAVPRSGVRILALTEAVADDSITLVFRFRNLTQHEAEQLRIYLMHQLNKPYDFRGALKDTIITPQRGACTLHNSPSSFHCTSLINCAFNFASRQDAARQISCIPNNLLTNSNLNYLGPLG